MDLKKQERAFNILKDNLNNFSNKSIIMPTINQILKKGRSFVKKKSKTPQLCFKPQACGLVLKLFTMAPKKPNSAIRKVARLLIKRTGIQLTAYRPGEEQKLIPSMHSDVLFQGGRPKDLPGIKYKIIKGKLGSPSIQGRRTSRSKYGTKKPYYTGPIEK